MPAIFLKNPLFGTGLLNFFYYEVELQKTITPVLLQPVHNIYFYWAVMTGIVGSIPAGIFVYRLYKKITAVNSLKKETVHQAGLLVGYVLIAGMFDHYFLTLQQGQLIAAILLGLLFSGQTKDLG